MRGLEQLRLAVDDSTACEDLLLSSDIGVSIVTIEDDDPVDAVVVTDPTADVEFDAPAICYADCDPESVPRPERFDAFIRRGDGASLETQLRWLVARSTHTADNLTRLRRLYEGSSRLIAAETTDELFERTIDIADRILAFDNSSISIDVGDGFRIRSTRGDFDEDDRIPYDAGLLGKTYRTGESRLINDIRTDEAADPHDPEYRSVISVPVGDIGVFQAISTEVGAFDETDRHLAELLVSYVAETAARIESEKALRESRSRIEALHRGTIDLAAVTDLDELFDRTVAVADEILSFDMSYIGVVKDGLIVPAAMSKRFPEDGAEPLSVEGGSVAADVYQTGKTRLVEDMDEAADANPVKDAYRSGLSVAIGDFAVFQAAAYTPRAFDEADAELTELLMAHVAVTAERIRAEENLREERDRSTALFEHVSDAAVAYEVDEESGVACIQSVNNAFEEQFGRRDIDIIGDDLLAEIVPDSERDPPELCVADGERHRSEVQRLADGQTREFILNVVPLDPNAADGVGYALYTDITERKQRESELERQNQRLEEFANIVSHDLRNPLAVAQGHLELAREVNREESFDAVADALDQMEELIDDLLSLARQGEVVGETTAVDVGAIARRAWDTVETADGTLKISSATMDADTERLAELFGNLFRNSVEHNDGDDGVTVRVGPLDDGFYVEDDGPGIAADRREVVFEPGETTGDDGIGYGLAIVSRIAEAHGWSVAVTESAAGGARFEFRVE
ncbi:GAF domain-containing protein [Halogeometricum borinquense]|uniref:histidine kinase n=1 Tax=Halogeometricum borinquense TaxID=60847 RepID=A0A6C0UCA9_9EURY|nr:GAF domain-containing protein [Halogeometricum borinquense]QIB72926.1 GAF domain-containing protein [Halogeometricum borinquense]QIQ75115.1 GAF domain-containing protein [Halogeometricum borinquense]